MFTDPKNVAGYVNVDIDVKELKKDKQLPPKPRNKQIQAYVLERRLCQIVSGFVRMGERASIYKYFLPLFPG